jgi:hypothetical protein
MYSGITVTKKVTPCQLVYSSYNPGGLNLKIILHENLKAQEIYCFEHNVLFIVKCYLKYHTSYLTQQNPLFITEYYFKIGSSQITIMHLLRHFQTQKFQSRFSIELYMDSV